MNFIINIIKSFFFSKERFQPIYFWSTCFLTLIVAQLIMKMTETYNARLSDGLILGEIGLVVALIGMYNIFNKFSNGGS